MTESRKDPRRSIELEVAYRRLNAFIVDYTRNVSRGGMFVASEVPLPPGTRLLFHLRVPGRAQPYELAGEVVHTGGGPQGRGMGIRFVWEDAQARAAFEHEVECRMVDSLGEGATRALLGQR